MIGPQGLNFASDSQWCCLIDKGSPSVMQHVVSVESSSLLLHSVETVFGVRVSVTFHLTCVHIIFSSVSVAEWPPFGK